MERVYLKPSPGSRVRDPVTKEVLSEMGKEVNLSSFWVRRIQMKDVIVCEPEAKKVLAPAPKAENEKK